MNWPPLTPECSRSVGDAIRDAVDKKPKDLLEHVARYMEEMSKLDPAEFEKHFETCRREPRSYKLEERCPASQDPMAWVPMRYSDDTIRLTLEQRALDLVAEIVSPENIENMSD